ncbi:hypothetical protein SDC9_176048 [bioreactor metagenome]|uniref:Uncharacterized protein n=1 Tax=bioreactor metagenome TaxID=1076179 RepID=A0A645GQZ6_9ZZZZ
MTHIRGSAVAVISNNLADDGHAAGRVAFIGYFFIDDMIHLARGLLDAAGDVVVGHVV